MQATDNVNKKDNFITTSPQDSGEGPKTSIPTDQVTQLAADVHKLSQSINMIGGQFAQQLNALNEEKEGRVEVENLRTQLSKISSQHSLVISTLGQTQKQLNERTEQLAKIEGENLTLTKELEKKKGEITALEKMKRASKKTNDEDDVTLRSQRSRLQACEDKLKHYRKELEWEKEQHKVTKKPAAGQSSTVKKTSRLAIILIVTTGALLLTGFLLYLNPQWALALSSLVGRGWRALPFAAKAVA